MGKGGASVLSGAWRRGALTVCRTGILAQLPLRIPEETVYAPASPRER
ncbi:hypothetical protein [Streptomyces sp. YPW6]